MTIELLTKYARMVEEIRSPAKRKWMTDYLLKISPEYLEEKLADYISRLENNYYSKPEDRFLSFLEEFERRGTLRPAMTRDEILKMAREAKKETYL